MQAQQWKNIRFSPLTIENGLSQLSVTAIFQDSRGFMWFGTRNGLNRYDGSTFKIIRFNDTINISENHILSICEDAHKNLWVGTTRGLNRIDFETGKITSYFSQQSQNSLSNNYIYSLVKDSKGRLWVGTKSGLNLYDEANDCFSRIYLNGLLLKNPISCMIESREHTILLGTFSKGLIEIDLQARLRQVYTNGLSSVSSISTNHIYSIYQDAKGAIWIGSFNTGLCELDKKTKSFISYHINQVQGDENRVRAIVEDQNGNLIIGSYNGLFLFNKKNHSFTSFSKISVPGGQLNHYSILSLKIDNARTLWVGTYAGGVSYYSPYNNRFTFYDPSQNHTQTVGILGVMVEDRNHNIWIASEGGGIIGLDKTSNGYRYNRLERAPPYNYSHNIIKSLWIENNTIYCGTSRSEVFKFDIKSNQYTPFIKLPGANKVVYEVIKDSSGAIWIGSAGDEEALYRVSPDGTLQSKFNFNNRKISSLSDVRCMLEIRKNVFLIGTRSDGLYLFNYSNGTLLQFNSFDKNARKKLRSNYITSIFRDSRRRIWVGTFGNGFLQFDEHKGFLRHFGVEEGLQDDNVCSIVESRDHNLWIGASSCISVLDFKTNKIKNYNKVNGIHLLELTPRAALLVSDGRIFFGGSNGFESFTPTRMQTNKFIPPVLITSFSVNNAEVSPGDESGILTKNLDCEKEIVLSHNQANISLSFAGLNYIFPEHNNYAIRLQGVDDGWLNIGTRNNVNYANLQPGKYTFKVKASNNDGLWNETPAQIKIRILPPLWLRWWAYLIYSCIVLAIFFTVLYYLQLKNKLESRISLKQLEQEKMEEFHQQRIQLFTNFSHELRTPLTLILTPLTELMDKSELLSSSYKDSLLMMRKNANRLLLLVNQLMDFRKTESGKMKLNVSEKDFISFISEIYFSFRELAKSQKVDLVYECDIKTQLAYFDSILLEKVYFNLLSNALKFCQENGQVRLCINLLESEVEKERLPFGVRQELSALHGPLLQVTVEDNGLGISKQNIENLFTPFFQAESIETKQQIGSGIGLSLTKSIMKLSRGAIWVESEESKGTIFTTILPVDKENFDPEEIVNEEPLFAKEEKAHELISNDFTEKTHTVLVVDDEEDLRVYISNILSPRYHVLTAKDGREGIEVAIGEMPDLILCDVMMPFVNGLEVCKQLKNNIKTGHIPIILLTSRVLSMQIQEGLSAGADEYITKPFNSSQLLLKINTLLENRERLKSVYSKKFTFESLGIEIVSSDERFMQQLNDIIQKHFSNPELDVDLIAKEIGMSRANLYRKVKSLTDLSTVDLIKSIRLQAAKEMLMDHNRNIAEISLEAGFNSAGYFATSFKKQYGMTPKEFQESLNNKS